MVVVGGPPRCPSGDSEAAPGPSPWPQGSQGTKELPIRQPESVKMSCYLEAQLEGADLQKARDTQGLAQI